MVNNLVRNAPQVKSRKSSAVRPPVILLDEVVCVLPKWNDSSSELTFGFHINEQLLLNEEEKMVEVIPVIVDKSCEF